jgi:hypothetical protein
MSAGRSAMSSAEVVAALGLAPGAETEQWRVAPATVAWNAVLFDSADVIAFVPALRVYPSGFHFTITALLRPRASEQAARGFADSGVVGPEAVGRPVGGLRIGVQFADGGRAALQRNASRPQPRTTATSLPLIGNDRRTSDDGIFEWGIHVGGIPKDGSVQLYHQWLELDIPEAYTLIDGDALRSAAARAVELWPPEPSAD